MSWNEGQPAPPKGCAVGSGICGASVDAVAGQCRSGSSSGPRRSGCGTRRSSASGPSGRSAPRIANSTRSTRRPSSVRASVQLERSRSRAGPPRRALGRMSLGPHALRVSSPQRDRSGGAVVFARMVGYPPWSGGRHAFLHSAGQLIDLGTLVGGSAQVTLAINNRGQIAGEASTPSGNRAFLATPITVLLSDS